MKLRTLKKYMTAKVSDDEVVYEPKEGILILDWNEGVNGIVRISITKIVVDSSDGIYVSDESGEHLEDYETIEDLENAEITVYKQISR